MSDNPEDYELIHYGVKGLIGLAAQADKATWGRKGRYENYANKSIDQINRDVETIKRGDDFLKRSGITRLA